MSCLIVDAAPIQRSITISTSSSTDATFSDWTTSDNSTTATVISDWNTATDVTNNLGQFSLDEAFQAPCPAAPNDLDCTGSGAGVGRDLKKFAYTWNNTNLFMYVERYASNTSANEWWFYLDTDADGLMESGEKVLNVTWTGGNGKTARKIWSYSPSRAAGDPITCPATGTNSFASSYCPAVGRSDGYDMPGSIGSSVTLSTGYYGGAEGASGIDSSGGALDGVAMETFIAWTDIGNSGPSSVGFHISSSNSTNIPQKLVDNMDGTGSSSIAFSDTSITKISSSAMVVGGRQFTYTITVTNNGDSNASNVEVTDIFPSNVVYVSDDSVSTSTTTVLTGTTLVWDIAALADGASVTLVVTMDSSTVLIDTAVSNTVDITNQDQADTDATNNSATADITLLPSPDLNIVKTVQTTYDPVSLVSSPKAIPGAYLSYTITTTNSGAGAVDIDSTIITDLFPAATDLFVGDISGGGLGPVLFVDGVTSSTLSYTFTSLDSATDDVDFSDDNGVTWTYYHDSNFSNIDADSFDSTVTDIRVNPKGQLAASAGGDPGFAVTFRVRLQ
ncbi:MAG: DUF11 domain-containing protein [Gammaproteobacteria bacterium]|nr:DUF11 domain-containing protein [Gammaproteobacteria bacterium]